MGLHSHILYCLKKKENGRKNMGLHFNVVNIILNVSLEVIMASDMQHFLYISLKGVSKTVLRRPRVCYLPGCSTAGDCSELPRNPIVTWGFQLSLKNALRGPER